MKEEDGSWVKTGARDLIAIGGVPFFILVLVRIYIIQDPTYFNQFLIAGVVFLVAFLFLKQETHSGLGLIVLVFLSLHYNDRLFTIVGSVAYVLAIAGLFYLKKDTKKVLLGILLGVVAIGASFLVLG